MIRKPGCLVSHRAAHTESVCQSSLFCLIHRGSSCSTHFIFFNSSCITHTLTTAEASTLRLSTTVRLAKQPNVQLF